MPTLLILLASALSAAQAPSLAAQDALFKAIQALDTRFFEAYNHCDLTTISSLVADDLDFDHDKTGLALGRQALLDGLKNNICNKVTRELVPGTLKVCPIAYYGAVEIGPHRFHHPGQSDNLAEAESAFLAPPLHLALRPSSSHARESPGQRPNQIGCGQ